MKTDWTKPDGFSRWGWVIPALQTVVALLNVFALVFGNGTGWNLAAALFCLGNAAFCYRIWRDGVRADAEHRAWMADFDRRWLS